jgi:hypothetical protein
LDVGVPVALLPGGIGVDRFGLPVEPQDCQDGSAANVSNIDDYVDEYRSRGFILSEATHRYKPGLRDRFVTLGCEYIELAWEEDEAVFAASGTEEFARMFPDLPALRLAASRALSSLLQLELGRISTGMWRHWCTSPTRF